MREHYTPISALFDKYIVREYALQALRESEELDAGLDLEISTEVLLAVLEQAPLLVAAVIARAADEPDQAHLVKTFNVGCQLDAVVKVVTLTLEAEGGTKKLVGAVMMLVKSMTPVAPKDPET